MPDPKESASEAPESQAPPVPEISELSTAQPTSSGTVDIGTLAKQVADLGKRIDAIPDTVARTVQSVKDKRLDAVDRLGDLAPLMEFKERLEASGGDFDKAIERLKIDQLLEHYQKASSQSVPGRTEEEIKSSAGKRAGAILRKANIPFDDPEYEAAFVGKSYATEDEFINDVLSFAAGHVRQAQPANPGTVTSEGGETPPPTDVDDIVAELNKLKLNPRALTDPKLLERRRALLDELAKLDPLK